MPEKLIKITTMIAQDQYDQLHKRSYKGKKSEQQPQDKTFSEIIRECIDKGLERERHLEGNIAKAEFAYQRVTRVKPLIITYSTIPKYVKYKCPVCTTLGNNHQISKGAENCPLCNVNLVWD